MYRYVTGNQYILFRCLRQQGREWRQTATGQLMFVLYLQARDGRLPLPSLEDVAAAEIRRRCGEERARGGPHHRRQAPRQRARLQAVSHLSFSMLPNVHAY